MLRRCRLAILLGMWLLTNWLGALPLHANEPQDNFLIIRAYSGPVLINSTLEALYQDNRTAARGDLSVWDGDKMIGYIRGRYMLPATETLQTRILLRIPNAVVNAEGKKEDKYFTAKELKGKKLTVLFTETDENQVQKDKVFTKTEVTL